MHLSRLLVVLGAGAFAAALPAIASDGSRGGPEKRATSESSLDKRFYYTRYTEDTNHAESSDYTDKAAHEKRFFYTHYTDNADRPQSLDTKDKADREKRFFYTHYQNKADHAEGSN